MGPLLCALPRPRSTDKNQFHWDSMNLRQYKHINAALNRILEINFRFHTEGGKAYTNLKDLRLTLHFVKKR